MKTYQLLPIAAATMLASLGVSNNAQADAYAVAYDNVSNLSITDTAGNPFPVGNINTFSTNSTSDAALSPNGLPVTCAHNEQGPTALCVSSLGSPTRIGFEQIGKTGTYSSGAAQILSTEIVQNPDGSIGLTGNTTQAVNIAETYVAGNGVGSAGGRNSSLTGLTMTFIATPDLKINFAFDADPYIQVMLSGEVKLGSNALGKLDVIVNLTDNNTGAFFNWAPDGTGSITGTIGGSVGSDPASLNTQRGVSSLPSTATYDPSAPLNGHGNFGAGPCGVLGQLNPSCLKHYSATTNALVAGDQYTLTLTMVETTQVRSVVPEPASLGLLGIGLVGMSLLRRRHPKA